MAAEDRRAAHDQDEALDTLPCAVIEAAGSGAAPRPAAPADDGRPVATTVDPSPAAVAGSGASGPARNDAGDGRAGRVALILGLLFGLTSTGSSAAAVVLPDLQGDLRLSYGAASWLLSVYVLMLAVTTAVYGRVADIVGIRKPLVLGVLVMAAGAVLSALASNLPLLLLGRALQGAGAGSVPVLATALISARFTGGTRSAALGRVAGTSAAVSSLGPLAGGAIAMVAGWRGVVALPAVGLLLLPAVARSAPTGGVGGRLDVRGAGLVAATAAGLVLLLQSASTGLALAGAGAGLLVAGIPLTVLHIRRRPDGFLPLAVVTRGRVLRAAVAGASVPAAWFALLLAVPATLDGRGWAPVQIGLILVPSAVIGVLAARRAGRVLQRLGGRRTLGGSALLAAASLLSAALSVEIGSPLLLVLSICAVTLSFSIGQPAMVSEVGAAVPPAVRGIALGVATLAFLVGGSLGSAAVGGLAELVGTPSALVAVAILPLAATAIALLAGRRSEPAGR